MFALLHDSFTDPQNMERNHYHRKKWLRWILQIFYIQAEKPSWYMGNRVNVRHESFAAQGNEKYTTLNDKIRQ